MILVQTFLARLPVFKHLRDNPPPSSESRARYYHNRKDHVCHYD